MLSGGLFLTAVTELNSLFLGCKLRKFHQTLTKGSGTNIFNLSPVDIVNCILNLTACNDSKMQECGLGADYLPWTKL